MYGFYFSKIFKASHSCSLGIVVFYVEYIKHDIRCVMYMMVKVKLKHEFLGVTAEYPGCALKNEVYNNSRYSYSVRCKEVAGYSTVKLGLEPCCHRG